MPHHTGCHRTCDACKLSNTPQRIRQEVIRVRPSKLCNEKLHRVNARVDVTFMGKTQGAKLCDSHRDDLRSPMVSRDGTRRVYALLLEDIIAIAKSRVTRTLTQDEHQKFLHEAQ